MKILNKRMIMGLLVVCFLVSVTATTVTALTQYPGPGDKASEQYYKEYNHGYKIGYDSGHIAGVAKCKEGYKIQILSKDLHKSKNPFDQGYELGFTLGYQKGYQTAGCGKISKEEIMNNSIDNR